MTVSPSSTSSPLPEPQITTTAAITLLVHDYPPYFPEMSPG